MAEFVISTCSTFDLTKEHADSRDISVIYFHYSKDGERLDDDLFQSVTPAEFYGSMVAGADMKIIIRENQTRATASHFDSAH